MNSLPLIFVFFSSLFFSLLNAQLPPQAQTSLVAPDAAVTTDENGVIKLTTSTGEWKRTRDGLIHVQTKAGIWTRGMDGGWQLADASGVHPVDASTVPLPVSIPMDRLSTILAANANEGGPASVNAPMAMPPQMPIAPETMRISPNTDFPVVSSSNMLTHSDPSGVTQNPSISLSEANKLNSMSVPALNSNSILSAPKESMSSMSNPPLSSNSVSYKSFSSILFASSSLICLL